MRLRLLIGTAVVAVACAAPAQAEAKPSLLRLHGIGPLKLGSTRAAAVKTGWLAHRATGCELGGPPVPITYRINGANAPSGLHGSVEFVRGKLANIAVRRGARTRTGVVVGKTSVRKMVHRYRRAGFSASSRYEPTFQGRFVTVKRHGEIVLGGFARKKILRVLSIPTLLVCE